MVEWKGELESDVGGKAKRLDALNSFHVPNFFVLSREEMKEFIAEDHDPEKIRNAELPDALSEKLDEAYDKINMSSEVRNASGKARNLVGGQRNGSHVSVRVSGGKPGAYEYRLNVGSSELEDALKQVVASFYEEHDEGYPALIFQKMIDSEVSGSVLKMRNGTLIEAVKGLGVGLEEAETKPDFYLPGRNKKFRPDEQLETSINPMNQEIRKEVQKRQSPLLTDSQLRKLAQTADSEPYSVKFVYSRGSFYAVDAFESPDLELPESVPEVQVSPGRVDGRTEKQDKPRVSNRAVVAEKGGYSSTVAQKMRQKGVPAVFSSENEEDQTVEMSNDNMVSGREELSETVTATEIMKADRDLPMKLKEKYGVDISQAYIEKAEDVLLFEGSSAVIDTSRMSETVAKKAVEFVEADFRCLASQEPSDEILEKAVNEGFDVIASREPQKTEPKVRKAEKKIILDASRKLLESE